MSSESGRSGDVSAKAAIELRPIAARLRGQIAIEDGDWDLVVQALAQALMAGVRIGGAEVAAQAIEQGLDIRLNLQVEPAQRDDDQ